MEPCIAGDRCVLRPWTTGDCEALVALANNPEVSRYLYATAFPFPYTEANAAAFLRIATEPDGPDWHYAIEVDGRLAGGVGLHPKEDVSRLSAELGYWLGEPFWGRGIATAAVIALVDHALQTTSLCRIFAIVFSPNLSSMRVLEKAGFVREAVLRRSVFKHGIVVDSVVYARTRDVEWPYGPYSG